MADCGPVPDAADGVLLRRKRSGGEVAALGIAHIAVGSLSHHRPPLVEIDGEVLK
jgi:hypothetical protein